MKVYGQLEKAQIEQLASDPGSPVQSQIWYNTTDSVYRIYDGTNVRDVEIASYSADPGSPYEGQVWYNSTEKAVKYFDGLSTLEVGTGGGLDVFHTEDFEANTASSFSTGNNSSFLGGGSFAGALTDETTNQIAGNRSLKYTQAVGSLNDYFASPAFSLERKQRGNDVGVNLYFEYDGNDGDIAFVLYDVTNAQVISSNFDLIGKSSISTRFAISAKVPSNCTSLRFGCQTKVENSGAVLVLDEVEFSDNPYTYKEISKVNSINLAGNAGEAVGANSPIPFAGTAVGWDGDEYTVQYDNSTIVVDFTIVKNANSTIGINLYVNGVSYKRIGTNDSAWNQNEATFILSKGEVQKGDVLSLRPTSAITIVNSSTTHYLNIVETQDAEENIIVAASKGVEEYFAKTCPGATPSTNTFSTSFSNVYIDTSDKYFSVTNNTTLGTIVTAKQSIELACEGVFALQAASMQIGFVKNGDGTVSITSNTLSDRYGEVSNAAGGTNAHSVANISLNAGETVIFMGSSNAARYTGAGVDLQYVKFTARPKEIKLQGAIPTEKVDVLSYDASGSRHTVTTSATTIPLDTQIGDGIATLTSNQFTLEKGKYDISAIAKFFMSSVNDAANIYLYNVTDAVEESFSNTAYVNVSTSAMTEATLEHVLDINENKTYEIRTIRTTGTGGIFIGDTYAGNFAKKKLQVKIRKLR